MNAVIGALRVSLGLDSAQFQDGIKGVKGQIGALNKVIGGLAAAGAFTALAVNLGQAVGRIEEMRKLTAQFDKALANVGNTADTTGAQLANFADRIEAQTGRAAEEIMAVGTNLATFGFNHDVFYNAIELANDMAAAWGGDLKQNVEGLARALADPEKGLAMLTKRGITFTEQQKAMIASFMKANDLVGAQVVVMDALNEQVQGVAAAGFTGLTKATANANKSVEDFFEALANGMQMNLGLEMALIAVAGAINFVTANLGTFGKAAGVAGAALLTAFAPAMFNVMLAGMTAFISTTLSGLRAIAVAAMANPLGAIIVALSAAVAAAFLFRDEIKQAIGVDVVGIIIDVGNKTVGIFVGAYEAVKEAWKQLPVFFSAIGKQAWNSFIETFEKPALTFKGWDGIERTLIPGMDLRTLKSQINEAETLALGKAEVTFKAAFDRDYFGAIFGGINDAISGASGDVQGFGDLLDETTSAGAAGVGRLTTGVDGLKASLGGTKDAMGDLWDTMKSGLSGIASGVAKAFLSTEDAATKALDAIVSGLDQIASRALDMAMNGIFDMLFGAFGSGLGWGNSTGGIFNNMLGGGPVRLGFNLPGFANGTNFAPGGLALVGERGPEIVNLPRGSQVIPNEALGGVTIGSVTIHANSEQEGRAAARGFAAELNQHFPAAMEAYQRNPLRRR